MSIGGHLEDLRRRLILALLGIVAASTLTLSFGRDIVTWLCRPLAYAQRSAHLPPHTYTLSPTAGFTVYLKVSIVSAIIVASPWVIYQVWRFFEQGLYARERKAVVVLAPFSAAMTTLGVLFMYYVMLPVSLWFLISFTASFPPVETADPLPVISTHVTAAAPDASPVPDPPTNTAGAAVAAIPVLAGNPSAPIEGQVWFDTSQRELKIHADGVTRTVQLAATTLISPLIEVGQYIGFVTALALGVVVAFQLPVVMLVTGWWGVVDPDLLAKYRRHIVLVCFATGALLTPADVLSMMLLSIPLWGLFEFGLWLMRKAHSSAHSNGAT